MKSNMKRLVNIFISLAAIVCAASSCQKEEEIKVASVDSAIVGEWHMTTINVEGEDMSEGTDVYLSINADGSFELYQQTGTQNIRFSKYTGICSTENNILSGIYSNGNPWGDKYTYKLEGDKLILTTYNLIETQTYAKAEIPAEVKENADTKSISEDVTPIL